VIEEVEPSSAPMLPGVTHASAFSEVPAFARLAVVPGKRGPWDATSRSSSR
jgi:hypothetical protein